MKRTLKTLNDVRADQGLEGLRYKDIQVTRIEIVEPPLPRWRRILRWADGWALELGIVYGVLIGHYFW